MNTIKCMFNLFILHVHHHHMFHFQVIIHVSFTAVLTNCFQITQSVRFIGKLQENDSKDCITNSLPSRIQCKFFELLLSRVVYDTFTGDLSTSYYVHVFCKHEMSK